MAFEKPSLKGMCMFLENLYVGLGPGVGCLRESPRIERNVCYTNTNYLAVHALRVCGSRLAENVERFLERYGYKRSGRFEVMWGEEIPYPPNTVRRIVLDQVSLGRETIEVRADVPTGTWLPDWQDYADLLVLAALEKLRRGETREAETLRNKALAMWDGLGFRDKAYSVTGLYESYKLSLYHFLAQALNSHDKASEAAPRILATLVSAEGGIVTHYDSSLKPRGDPNLETTSVTVLALYSNYPARLRDQAENMHWLISAAGSALLGAMLWLVWRRRRKPR